MRDVMYNMWHVCSVFLCSLGLTVAHYLVKKMRKLFTQHLVIKSFSLSHIAVQTESLDYDYDGWRQVTYDKVIDKVVLACISLPWVCAIS